MSDEEASDATSDGATAEGSSAEYERILAENRRYVDAFDRSALTAAPLSGIAIPAIVSRLRVGRAMRPRQAYGSRPRMAGR